MEQKGDKKKMKKYFLIFALLFVSLLPLVANGQNEGGDGQNVKLVAAIWGGDTDKMVMEEMLKAAAWELEGIEVEFILLADYDKTVTTRLVGGQQIDIIAVGESVHQFSSRNQLVPLNDYITTTQLDMDNRFGSAKDLYAKDGNVFALPLRGGPLMLYCNMDVLGEKPGIDWRYEEFLNAAQKAYKPGETTASTMWGFVPAGNGTWWPWYTSFIYSAGGSLVDEDGKPNFDDPLTIQGLKNYAGFVTTTKVGPSLQEMADIGQTSPDPVFNSGKAAMIATGWWNVGSLNGAAMNWDIAPMPNDKGRGSVIFGQGLAISATSEHKEAAFKVIQALTDLPAQKAIVDCHWDIPSNLNVLNSVHFRDSRWSRNPLDMKVVAEAIERGAIKLPYNNHWNQMHDVIGNVVNELLKGNVTAEEAANRIQEELVTLVFID